MFEKKKKEEPEIYHTPFGTITIPPYPEIDLSPYTIETTALGDSQRSFLSSSTGARLTYTEPIPSIPWDITTKAYSWENILKKSEEENTVNVQVEEFKGEYIAHCSDPHDLTPERILLTLSAIKGKLMLDIAPVHVKELQCKMTPSVRRNIITASKRLKMYGKKRPIIARFDEYGNRLPDEIELGTPQGVALTIVEPENYGDFYLELKAIEFSSHYTTKYPIEPLWSFDEEIPF